MNVTRREFLHSAGATAMLATIEAGALLVPARIEMVNRQFITPETFPGPASIRVLREDGKWVSMHRQATGKVLACVRFYGY